MKARDEILRRLNFNDFYASELKNFRVRGGKGTALCPFHDDRDPSLSINLREGLFFCFGCGQGGDVFTFYMKRHGCGFKEALKALADFVGVR